MAKQKKLDRWMAQLEALLNDGTREYRTLDVLLNSATTELAAIKRAKDQHSILADELYPVLDVTGYSWRYSFVLHGDWHIGQRL